MDKKGEKWLFFFSKFQKTFEKPIEHVKLHSLLSSTRNFLTDNAEV